MDHWMPKAWTILELVHYLLCINVCEHAIYLHVGECIFKSTKQLLFIYTAKTKTTIIEKIETTIIPLFSLLVNTLSL